MEHFREFHQQEENVDGGGQKSTNLFLSRKNERVSCCQARNWQSWRGGFKKIVNDDACPRLKDRQLPMN